MRRPHGWTAFYRRPGTPSDGDFNDGSGNFCIGKLFHETAIIDCPGYDTYELVHNGGSGRILFDLAEHYFLTGDTKWFKKNQWRMQAAAEWIIRQRKLYMNNVPNREDLAVAGLHPPQHIADLPGAQRMEMVREYRRLVLSRITPLCRGHGASSTRKTPEVSGRVASSIENRCERP